MQKKWILAFGLVLGVAACGNTLGEQAVFGGAAGAGVAVVTDGDPITGAVIGAGGNVAFCQMYPHRCR